MYVSRPPPESDFIKNKFVGRQPFPHLVMDMPPKYAGLVSIAYLSNKLNVNVNNCADAVLQLIIPDSLQSLTRWVKYEVQRGHQTASRGWPEVK